MDPFEQLASRKTKILPQTIYKRFRKRKDLANYGDWIIATNAVVAIAKSGRELTPRNLKTLLKYTDCGKIKSVRVRRELIAHWQDMIKDIKSTTSLNKNRSNPNLILLDI